MLILAPVLTLLACGGSVFRPRSKTCGTALPTQAPSATPATGTPEAAPPTRVELLAIRNVQNRIRFEVQVVPRGSRITRAYIRGPFTAPCGEEGGGKAKIEHDLKLEHWSIVELPGDAPVRGTLDDGAFLDVWLEPLGQCARVAVSAYAMGYQHVSDPLLFTVGARVNLAAPPAGDMVGMFSLPIGLGGWIGDVRTQATLGLGTASCSRSLCGSNAKDDTLRFGWFFPATVEAGVIDDWGSDHRAINMGVYLGARYGVGFGLLPALSGQTERRTVHMVAAVLGMDWFDAQPAAFQAVEARGTTVEFAIPLGVAFSHLGKGSDLAFMTGLEGNLFFGL